MTMISDSVRDRYILRCLTCREDIGHFNHQLLLDASPSILGEVQSAVTDHRARHHGLNPDSAYALVVRAVKECFPERADEILRVFEKAGGRS
jgi:hypothetical protein